MDTEKLAAEILKLPPSPEFINFYNYLPDLSGYYKFLRALSYGQYPDKIYKGSENFVSIEYCMHRAVVSKNNDLINYFLPLLAPGQNLSSSLIFAAKEKNISLIRSILRNSETQRPDFLLYLGKIPDNQIAEIKAVWSYPHFDQYIMIAKLLAGKAPLKEIIKSKPNLANLLKIVTSFGDLDLAEKIINLDPGLENLLPLDLLLWSIGEADITSIEELLHDIKIEKNLDLIVDRIISVNNLEVYKYFYDYISDLPFFENFIILSTKAQSTSPIFKMIYSRIPWNRVDQRLYIKNHLNDPLAVAILLSKVTSNIPLGSEIWGYGEVYNLSLLLSERQIYGQIAKLFGF